MAAFDRATQHLHHHLLAVTDAKHWHTQIENACGRTWRAFVNHAGRATGQDHCFGGEVFQEGVGYLLERVDFAINVQLAQATGDQLCDLAAKVDDKKTIMCAHAWRE